jgi:hypothetical protein
MPDGSIAVLSPTAGTWIFKVGALAAIAFVIMAAVLFWRSRGRQGE